MKITKKTLAALKKYGKIYSKNLTPNSNYNYRILLIAELLTRSYAIAGNTTEGYEIYDTDSHGVTTIHGDFERKTIAGMTTRYPNYIKASLTHGLNEVTIINPNKLVNAILSEK